MSAVIHVGPPKTATKSIQRNLIPALGRPAEIRPSWLRDLCRKNDFTPPKKLADNVIVSEEHLADFAVYSPAITAKRLASVFHGGTVIFVVRNSVERFYSLFQQRVINSIYNAPRLFANDAHPLPIASIDQNFDHLFEIYRKSRCNFFAAEDHMAVSAAFLAYFDFRILDFELLKRDALAFIDAFCSACGETTPADLQIGHENSKSAEVIERALATLPAKFTDEIKSQYRQTYLHSRLSADREAFLRQWTTSGGHFAAGSAFASSFKTFG